MTSRTSACSILALCCVETTTEVARTGLPLTYCRLIWLLASGPRSGPLPPGRGGRQGRARAARPWIGGETGVDHPLGTAVATLVRMPLAHGLTGTTVLALGHTRSFRCSQAWLAQPGPGMAHPNCVHPHRHA